MDCKQAEKLFDAYLDGELSPSLSTELGAHRLQCPKCRRALALLQVTGHIVTADREPTTLSPDFTDRLLACVDEQENSPWAKWRNRLYLGAPMAAAAVIILAFAGFFDAGGDRPVAGVQEKNPMLRTNEGAPGSQGEVEIEQVKPADQDALADWYQRASQNVRSKQKSGESLQKVLDKTAEQMLDILEQSAAEAKKSSNDANAPNGDSSPEKPAPLDGGGN